MSIFKSLFILSSTAFRDVGEGRGKGLMSGPLSISGDKADEHCTALWGVPRLSPCRMSPPRPTAPESSRVLSSRLSTYVLVSFPRGQRRICSNKI